MNRALQAAVLACWMALPLSPVRAQDGSLEGSEGTEPRGEVSFVLQGRPAPFSGFLIEGEDLARWRFHIETLEYRLARDAEAAAARLEVLLDAERARTSAAEERLLLRNTLWTQRTEELATALAEARRSAQREWWESPLLWFASGVIVAIAATIALAASL